jgi:hypothetical protein
MSSLSNLVRWLLSILWAVFTKLFSRRCSVADEALAGEPGRGRGKDSKASVSQPPNEDDTEPLYELPSSPWQETPGQAVADNRSSGALASPPPSPQLT